MEAVAKLKNCPMSARKMRMVVDTIRGKDVETALNILAYTKREGGVWIEKLLLSAICLLYTSPSPRDLSTSRMPSSA